MIHQRALFGEFESQPQRVKKFDGSWMNCISSACQQRTFCFIYRESVNGRRGARKEGFTNDTEGYALPDETQSHFQTECTSYRSV